MNNLTDSHTAPEPGAEPTFSEMELRRCDGQKGRPAYIAYAGVVYDVTQSTLWRDGMHKNLHYAGLDLTRSLRKAPHDASVFARMRRVGLLKAEA